MTEPKPKSSLMKKYVSILQTDTKPSTAKPFYSPQGSLSRQNSSELLERVIITRRMNANQSMNSFQDLNNLNKPSTTKSRTLGSEFAPSPNHKTPRTSIVVAGAQPRESPGRNLDETPITTLNGIRHDPVMEMTGFFQKDAILEMPTYLQIRSAKNTSRKSKETTLQNLYESARDFSAELESIVSQKYQKKLEESMLKFQTKEFINIQSLRVGSVLRVLEKNFVEGQTREPQLNQEIWKMAAIEINKIKGAYDDFLGAYHKLSSKLGEVKEKNLSSVNILEGIKNLVAYSECYRDRVLKPEQREKNLEDLKKTMHTFKLDLKFKSKFSQKAFEVYDVLEKHIKGLNQSLDNEMGKVQCLLQENIRLVQQQAELETRQSVLKTEIVSLIDKKEVELKNKSKECLPDFQRKLLEEQISDSDKQVKKLTADNEHLRSSLRNLKEEHKKLNPKGSSSKTYREKGTMVNLYSETAPTEDISKTLLVFNCSEIKMTAGTKMPDILALSMISLIYSDKLVTDAADDFEKRPRTALGPFVFEWFLRRFGLYTVCETIMRDFLFTLRYSKPSYDRYRTFLAMIGVGEVSMAPVKKLKHESEPNLDPRAIKKQTYKTAESLKVFYKFIEQVNTANQGANSPSSPTSPTSRAQLNEFGPFLPRLGSSKDNVNVHAAHNVMKNMFRECGFSIEESEDAMDEFNIVQQQTFYQRLELKDSIDDYTKEDDSVSFDTFLDFMLDTSIRRHIKTIEHVYTSLRAATTSKNEENLAYSEFTSAIGKMFPKRSQAWRDHAYAKFLQEPLAGQINLQKLIPNFVEAYFNEDQAKESILNQPKKEATMILEESTPKSPKKGRKIEIVPVEQTPNFDYVEESKQVFQFGNATLNDMGYYTYDAVSSLIVLQELFYIFEGSIKEAEAHSDAIHFAHKSFLEEMRMFPKHFGYTSNYKDIRIMKKKELVSLLEYMWGLFRTMLMQTFRSHKNMK